MGYLYTWITIPTYPNTCQANIFFFFFFHTPQGRYPGPALAALLEKRYGVKNVAVQGLNYNGGIFPNVKAQGTEDKAIALLKHLITDAFFACRKSKIVVAAYGQGACAVHAAFETLDADILERVNGVVTFGDPRYVRRGVKRRRFGRLLGSPGRCKYGVCKRIRMVESTLNVFSSSSSDETAEPVITSTFG